MNTALTNEEKMNGERFEQLSEQMKGVIFHSMSEKLRNEEIMVKLSLSEEKFRGLCKKYGVKYGFRLKERKLEGDKTVTEAEMNEIIARRKMDFNDLITYDRSSQRKIIYSMAKKLGSFRKMIRSVFNVEFFDYFLALYAEEKLECGERKTNDSDKKKNKKSTTLKKEDSIAVMDSEVAATMQLADEHLEAPTIQQDPFAYIPTNPLHTDVPSLPYMNEDQFETSIPPIYEDPFGRSTERVTEDPFKTMKLPSETLDNLDPWDLPLPKINTYSVVMKQEKTTKKQLMRKLEFLVSELEDVEDDAILSVDIKVEKHQ